MREYYYYATHYYIACQSILLKLAAFPRPFFFSHSTPRISQAGRNKGSFEFDAATLNRTDIQLPSGGCRCATGNVFGNEISEALWLVRYAY